MIRALPCLLLFALPVSAKESPLTFEVTLSKSAASEPRSGRLFVMLAQPVEREPRLGPGWINTQPFFAVDVKDWKPGETRTLGPDALAYPTPLAKLKPGKYAVQAVLDLDRGGRHFGSSPGNLFSKSTASELDASKTGKVTLVLDQTTKERKFDETDRVKLVDIESKLLSAFHKKSMRLRAGVVLPKGYDDNPKKQYPVVYEIPGFSGSHFMAHNSRLSRELDKCGVDFLYVMLDPDCRTGHHVFADSANNGPYGKALIEELIPHIEKTYRGLGRFEGRFVTGHSSGGWSSLWLQVNYPDVFGGTWSTAPDPVDFRDWQQVNIYKPNANMFTDEAGKPRPIARRAGKAMLWYRGFSDMEEVFGRGGQLMSFEAVFSPRGTDGQPRKLWDRKTGAIDPEVAKAWQKYDIGLILERNWTTLKPKLSGKLHVYMGADDNFYLDGATRLLKEGLAKRNSNAKIEIVPGKDHSTLLDATMIKRIAQEMAEKFRGPQS